MPRRGGERPRSSRRGGGLGSRRLGSSTNWTVMALPSICPPSM